MPVAGNACHGDYWGMQKTTRLAITFLAILGLTSACPRVSTPPAGADGLKIEFIIKPEAPSAAADTELIVQVKNGANQPVAGATVTISYDMASMAMGETTGQAVDEGAGRYTLITVFAHPGRFKFKVKAEKSGQTTSTFEKEVDVR